jgi:hypothetical protein
LPRGATILRIAAQGSRFFLWALLGKAVEQKEKRKFLVVGTGHEFPPKAFADLAIIAGNAGQPAPYAYQETAIALDGRLVFHFFISHPVSAPR